MEQNLKTGDASQLFDTILALKPANHPASAIDIDIIQLEKVSPLKQYASLGMTPSQMWARLTTTTQMLNLKLSH